ncbi:protein phosphatase 2A regulatory subunit [Dictyostelium discoideum AX4]|uniref:Serine/threonine-protein phosphatase 2A regulatory subunit phr2AB n=1 Tax=Dictyostelium discoideum TaxID=44689 RepID=PH2AB_DICDI|nr:protein phosphatase 2A regulatory subunit [Dictyostelium discoideum AX4]Q54Q99.1 RecName: Full=Serine/threonine-protein phosphatase 2A regulatory subunit phr2AB; AltName: Full=Protein phosphatase 2A 55 kDa regulatory subunit; AltName: Full=Protein phosphatase 2A B55 regulatory subunit; AltName: Full=Protein phosphatase 2A PR55 regulatory subunit; AltName: Full=Protein phosphatase 2A regulatory B subunit [Dictyostelium discoideum]EAL65440.1 protein phosphatase 2A regulatory subunit [Dictyosteli|eukprot:XP_638845.1 protein phosphatase 2A regulatory subunit [Dictyostelium discoideum AX4]
MTEPLDWRFSQTFGGKGNEDASDANVVPAIEFDQTGDFIAVGDKGGKVLLLKRTHDKQSSKKSKLPEYRFYSEFQSHEPEFDYLKSLEIEEKINKIKWCPKQNDAQFLLTTNDKTIKLWKVYEKKIKQVSTSATTTGPSYNGSLASNNTRSPSHTTYIYNSSGAHNMNNNMNNSNNNNNLNNFKIPKLTTRETVVTATPRKIFQNAHAYHINSISLNSDGETYISSDDLRIHLWNLNINTECFNVVDIKPTNMEDLTEVITSAEFHPTSCNIFMYSSSKGTIKLGDLRSSALCDNHAKVFEEYEDPSNKSFFSEIISSISDIKFSRDGRYILSRDFLTLKLWDINMENKPVKTIQIHDYLKPKLCDLYENDCIFDKFECTLNHDGTQMLTGSYHNYLHIYDRNSKQDVCLEASKQATKSKTKTLTTKMKLRSSKKEPKKPEDIHPDAIEYTKKTLHCAWHPKDNLIAVGAANTVYLYAATENK